MRGDIVLKVIISFIIPFLVLYSFSCIFYINALGMLAILNCLIAVITSYLLFYLRFNKIEIQKVISIKRLFNIVIFCFTYFLFFLLIKLLEQMSDFVFFSNIVVICAYLLLFFVLLFVFLFTRRPIVKIIVLAFAYNIILFFITYNLYLFNIENNIIDFIILIVFGCLLNVLSGIFIINNLAKDDYAK